MFASLCFRDYRWVFVWRALLYLGYSVVNGFTPYVLENFIDPPHGVVLADGVATALVMARRTPRPARRGASFWPPPTARAALHDVADAARARDVGAYDDAVRRLLGLIDAQEAVLGANEHFLLGRWLADARAWGREEEARRYLVTEAKRP
ncbi:alpha-N-acetylglucosaminidase C-terminal domain-containing protein [Streptomyces chartreusis]|uniref:alpha-N-acetylglucosaminidase C-terminal domain-containing protein n=1 Tax=Streptomyces chartreusis TaxID=1969 RepID=UPI00368BEFA1